MVTTNERMRGDILNVLNDDIKVNMLDIVKQENQHLQNKLSSAYKGYLGSILDKS